MVILNVSVKGEEDTSSGDYAIQRVNSEDSQEYSVELEALRSSLDENSAISALILAEFYEQNHLILDALTSYEHAIQTAPDIDYFQQAYKEFLMRNGYSDDIE
jgi:Tfp pilus assembly protein PilF